VLLFVFTVGIGNSFAQPASSASVTNNIRIVELQGSVEILPAGRTAWIPAKARDVLHPFDRIHTAAESRVALAWSDQSILPFGASTELEILPPDSPASLSGLHLVHGILSFFHRDQPGRIRILTRGAVAGVEGTEFVLAVDDADTTTLSVVDGRVRFGNDQATLTLTNGQQAAVALGQAPVRTAGFIANNLLQWCFYYPAVIDPAELPFTTDDQTNLASSLAAYHSGDLLAALAAFPTGPAGSGAAQVYHAALLLSVGDVARTEATLSAMPADSERLRRLAGALRELIAAVKRQPAPVTAPPQLASELLAGSYFEQSRAVRETSLRRALTLAQSATVVSPKFAFAWARLAELEFSFGRMREALTALNTSLALAPRNAQALALKGFVLAAQNNPRAARASFDAALTADSALGNAWLGRGLSRIRTGDLAGGREDLLIAAALEPQRAELRSYLGKAYLANGDDAHATKELNLAKRLDPADPTAWLYSALQHQQANQVNDAIRDLEKSQALNDNRSVYRSQLLLDEDHAVRSANLAGVYLDAGMTDVSTREAGKAVSADYANYSAHLFLANSYEQLRDPNWSNLRYETPTVAEFWIANLLAPPSAGTLSPLVSQQPYTKLFDQNRLGVVSDTTYLSRGAWMEEGAQFGVYDNFSYDFEAQYISDPGQRSDNDKNQRDLQLTLKDQFTPQDSAFFSVEQDKISTGDVNQYYNQANAFTGSNYRFNETQEANLYFGYHHEWGPGSHTLFLASRQIGYESPYAVSALQLIGSYNGAYFNGINYTAVNEQVQIDTELNTAELQQILESPNHTTIIGTRFEWGDVRYQNVEYGSDAFANGLFPDAPGTILNQDFTANFYNYTAYGYHTWQIADPFAITVGLAYDWLQKPADVATTPFATQANTTNNVPPITSTVQFSPKVGFVWQPADRTTFRGAYTHSLSGFANGQSTRLEPTEVAGFNQAYRSLAPEAVVGDSSGSKFDTIDLSLEQKFDTGTYLALSGQLLYSKLDELQGDFVSLNALPLEYYTYPLGFKQSQNYREATLRFTVDQLLGRQWSAGATYTLSDARLNLNYVDINAAILAANPLGNPLGIQPNQTFDSVLNTVTLHANWNHPSGLFSVFDADWYHQNNSGFNPAEPGNDFWQFNAYAGYRMLHRRVEFTIGLLNLFDQNYSLEPLNLYNEMARSRTFLTRLRISF